MKNRVLGATPVSRTLLRLACGLMAGLCWLVAGGQTGRQQAADERRIVSLENAWNQAVQLKDVGALVPLLDDELVYIEIDGTLMNKAQYLAGVQSPAVRFERVVSEGMQVHSYGNGAVVTGVYREIGVRNGKPYLHRERFVDTWVNKHDFWICVSSQSTAIAH